MEKKINILQINNKNKNLSDDKLELEFESFQDENAKISLIQNANTHFLREDKDFNFNFDKDDILNNKFKALHVVDTTLEPFSSELPPKILEMRINSHNKEKKQRKTLIDMLNSDFNYNEYPKNYHLKGFVSPRDKNEINEINDSFTRNVNSDESIFSLNKNTLKEQSNTTENKNEEDTDTITDELLSSNQMKLNPLKSPLPELSTSVLDFTTSGKTDDMDRKFKKHSSNSELKVHQNLNDTTILINELVNAADRLKNKTQKQTTLNFDDYETWFDEPSNTKNTSDSIENKNFINNKGK